MRRSSPRVAAFLGLVLAACTTGAGEAERASPAEGPPEVQAEVVAEHAAQFDDEIAERPAGSQQEFLAASYITGHLQSAGYRVRLDAVPVANLVESTNVVAVPPAGRDPLYAIILAYDNGTGVPPQGEGLGLFLELARALAVRAPEHRVEFVALGAEFAPGSGGNLGSRAYLGSLQEEGLEPFVITPAVVEGGGFSSLGPEGDLLNEIAGELGLDRARPLNDPAYPSYLRITEMYADAGVDHAIAAGGVDEVGRVLLELLSG